MLVVNDDLPLADSMRKLLEDDGFSAQSSPDGQAAMEVLASLTPDFIVLDLRMPRLDGFAFLRQRAADARLRCVPVVVWSSAGPEELGHARLLGADESLSAADTDPDRLLAVMSEVLTRPSAPWRLR